MNPSVNRWILTHAEKSDLYVHFATGDIKYPCKPHLAFTGEIKPMTKRSDSLTVTCKPETKLLLDELALKFDCLWGESPNLSLLIERIADGTIPTGKPTKSSEARKTINQSRKALLRAIAELDAL